MKYIFIVIFLFSLSLQASEENNLFVMEYQSLRGKTLDSVRKYSWRNNCPIKPSELILLKVSYWGFDNQAHIGELIVHRKASPEVFLIFKELFDNKFPIESIVPMYHFYGNDFLSMTRNNTVAYNCRVRTNYKNKYSKHSYGIAIDINPFINPYHKNGKTIPPEAKKNLDREKNSRELLIKIIYATIPLRVKGGYGEVTGKL